MSRSRRSRMAEEGGTIRRLDPSVVSKIAAGEVVERPASALKELVENAIDSGADRIRINLVDGGVTLLSVTDNGRGMSAADLREAVQAHTTSKLSTLEDLERIQTLGFRGEALAAICSVANVTVRSRKEGSDDGSELALAGSWSGEEPRPCVARQGTEVVVRDFFSHTPARRKFLRKPQTEWAHCEVLVQAMALGNPQVGFALERDGRVRREWPPQGLRERAFAVLGPKFEKAAVAVDRKSGPFRLHGHVDLFGTGSKSRQFFFLNGRAVDDKLLRQAVLKAFRDMLRGPDHPYVLFLTMPPGLVDVNAHPAKLEVRFKEPSSVFSFVHSVLDEVAREPVGANPDIELAPAGPAAAPAGRAATGRAAGGGAYSRGGSIPRGQPTPTFVSGSARAASGPGSGAVTRPRGSGPDDVPPNELGRVIGMLHGIYLLTESDRGMVVIDVHAAHERIIYEELKKGSKVREQALLEPVELDLSPVEMDAVAANRELLAEAGLRIRNESGVEVLAGLPAAIAERIEDPVALADECIREVMETGRVFAANEMVNQVLSTAACHAAVRGANPFLSGGNLEALLKRMGKTIRSGRCNHGRPCWRVISLRDLDSSFERGR